jgi:DNA polymerase-1
VSSLALDTKLAAYLLDPADPRYDLAELLAKYAGAEMAGEEGTPPGQLDLGDGDGDGRDRVTARRALATAALAAPMREALEARGLTKLNDEVEVPLVRVLARMEDLGIGVDRDELQALADRLVAEVAEEREAIVASAGPRVQRQLHPAAAGGALRRAGSHPAEEDEKPATRPTPPPWRSCAANIRSSSTCCATGRVEKLRSTYGEGLLAEVAVDGRNPCHVQPDGRSHRASELGPAQPAQHSGALRRGPPVSPGICSCPRVSAVRRRLQPDRVALHRSPVEGPWAGRCVHRRRGHPRPRPPPASSRSNPTR